MFEWRARYGVGLERSDAEHERLFLLMRRGRRAPLACGSPS